MEDLRNQPIPKDVVNVREYKKYLAFVNHPIIRNTKYVSTEGDEINIAMLPHRLKKFIEHLSLKEQEEIMELKRKYNVYRARISTSKAIAFGRRAGLGEHNLPPKPNPITPFEEDIVELLGRLFTVPEVIKIMHEDNGIEVTQSDVLEVLKKYITEVEKRRDEFRNKVVDVRLYNKRPRLEELAWMYLKLKERYKLLNSTDLANTMLRTLEQIRKEAEGDVINFNGALDVNIEVTLQNHIHKQALKTINLKEIILGRVSARMGYDPKKLVTGLHNSYYNKFVVISGDFEENAEMVYPSSKMYDFDEIERTAGREVIDVTPEVITEAETSSAANVRDLFLAKIRKQKEEYDSKVSTYDERAKSKSAEEPSTEEPVKRPAGRGKDKTPPSKTKMGIWKNRNKDYKTGKKKE